MNKLQWIPTQFGRAGSEVCNELGQFHYIVANEVASLRSAVGKFVGNFGTKFGVEFHGSISTVTNCLTQQGKAILSTGLKRIVDH